MRISDGSSDVCSSDLDDVPGTLVDTDGGGTADLTMTEGHDYTTAGEEDAWFSLSTDPDEGGSFKLENGWNNEDSSEQTYARLTPELVAGAGSQEIGRASCRERVCQYV